MRATRRTMSLALPFPSEASEVPATVSRSAARTTTATRAATSATAAARSSSRTSPSPGASVKRLSRSTARDFSEGLEQHSIGSFKPLTLLTIFYDHFTMNAFTRDEIGTGFGRRFTSDGF